ncbi:MAG: alpha-amylase/4-alpha-glucanotransferase domain-containing protein [Candidatus Omnitrophota bacterium]
MKADLLLIIHFHQPVGNFDNVIKRVHDRCYKPFLDIVSQYPALKFSMHFSGCLLEWFEKNTPEILETIKKLVKRGQVEIIGGGFYEPILSIIPERDRQGQLSMMRDYVGSRFGVKTHGAWIAERVWEPELISTLSKNDIDYVVLDDMHFVYAGLRKEDTYGYFISENNGRSIRVLPSDKELRYIIPFSEPDKPISYMRDMAQKKEGVIFTYGDDAEKFGEWPGTHKWVYEDKWLVRFLDALSKASDWLVTRTVSECLKDKSPLGRVYLPTASYEEMLEWALPVDASMALHDIKEEIKKENKYERYSPFIRGGFFRNFLVKYEESNQMHKRMLYVSDLVEKCAEGPHSSPKILEARSELYRGQCNCAYWHGIFGGLYLYHLRKAIYEHILKAEKICQEARAKGKTAYKAEVVDFDADGHDEVILQNKKIWACVKPSKGGSVVELDSKERAFNLLNVLTRYKEAYHRNITAAKESGSGGRVSIHDKEKAIEGFTGKIVCDRYRKSMFRDHFFEEGTTLKDFEGVDYAEAGDFADSSYDFKASDGGVTMERKGTAYDVPVSIKKEVVLDGSALKVFYSITNLGKKKREFWFGTEAAFIMPEADSSRYAYVLGKKKYKDTSLLSRGITEHIDNAEVTDTEKELGLKISFSKECDLWRFPIKTVSQSEKDYEENYQGSVILLNWHFSITPRKSVNFEIEFRIGHVS